MIKLAYQYPEGLLHAYYNHPGESAVFVWSFTYQYPEGLLHAYYGQGVLWSSDPGGANVYQYPEGLLHAYYLSPVQWEIKGTIGVSIPRRVTTCLLPERRRIYLEAIWPPVYQYPERLLPVYYWFQMTR